MINFTHFNLSEVADSAEKYGFGESQESRFANKDLGTEQTGLSHHLVKPGKQQAFAHRHESVEEVYVVLAGSGSATLDDETVQLKKLDALRVAPKVLRRFTAGPDGLELLAFSALNADDKGEIVKD